ncbi:MazG nucleotide pyrophosphohydrolase domain-containing protein [Enterococcus pallens]|uniref:Uncharacterized protein n=1 Tax=Enterococcus pallens ATCC BAA-351 TaxID=1158607 RepID=R2QN66_9ENTE|nr:MazG nucleotide pyrophosphohydrolase domain-containing protein [Enterococcus pallens]EOH97962.1 hypothetical protein UAU_00631 [Enterococcus pallens ATCC BAA-351]EOU20619.1 hypothetical protein I588_01465 [Enterococcus pallens ATCC BAA-351]OJG80354.1 hypothetical protein RV10_GL004566 [Enterococcus pallens]
MNELLDEIFRTAEKEQKNEQQLVLKLMEEVGETAQALLSSQKAPGSEYKMLTTEDVKEEIADTLLVAFALLHKLGTSNEQLQDLLETKLAKWQAKQDA